MFNDIVIGKIKDSLMQREERIAVAESVTAGFLQAALASAESATGYFEGGITAYNINQKVKHLAVDRRKAEACNCVSPQTAAEMAVGVCRLFGTEWGIAVTGYATPVPESDFSVYAFFAICFKGQIISAARLSSGQKDAIAVQLQFVYEILEECNKILEKELLDQD